MNATEAAQIIVDPEDRTDDFIARIENAAARSGKMYSIVGLSTKLKLMAGRFLHPLRIHTWVRWLQYDSASERVIETGMYVCFYCTRGKVK